MGGDHPTAAGSPGWRSWLTPAWAGTTGPRPHRERRAVGSPPHGRGPLLLMCAPLVLGGLTPAWAGTTRWSSVASTQLWAHPRMGGDHRAQRADHGPVRGLTPAWAGTTGPPSPTPGSPGAHPRMGGDHLPAPTAKGSWPGSPPHGRGPQAARDSDAQRVGLTPAWAGTTRLAPLCARARRAHPRMGGDHLPMAPGARVSAGSPPHGRGPHHVGRLAARIVGLTPAWAGTTMSMASVRCV